MSTKPIALNPEDVEFEKPSKAVELSADQVEFEQPQDMPKLASSHGPKPVPPEVSAALGSIPKPKSPVAEVPYFDSAPDLKPNYGPAATPAQNVQKVEQGIKDTNAVGAVSRGADLLTSPMRQGAKVTGQYIQSEAESMDPETMEYPGLARAYKNVVAPAGEASSEFLGSQFDKTNLVMLQAFKAIPTATAAGRALHTAIGAYFGSKMGAEGVQQAYDAYLAEQGGNVPEAVKLAANAIFNFGFATEGTVGAAKGGSGIVNDISNTVARPSAETIAATPEPSPALISRQNDLNEATQAMTASMQREGTLPVPQAPQPVKHPPVNDKNLRQAADDIASLPKEQQEPALLKAHDELTQALTDQGKAVIDGKLVVVDSPKTASKVAAEIVTEGIKRTEKGVSKGQQKSASADELTQNVPNPTTPQASTEESLHKLGDRVSLKDGKEGIVNKIYGKRMDVLLPDGKTKYVNQKDATAVKSVADTAEEFLATQPEPAPIEPTERVEGLNATAPGAIAANDNRSGNFFKVTRSGASDMGKNPDATVRDGEGIAYVTKDGEIQIEDGSKLDPDVIRKNVQKVLEARGARPETVQEASKLGTSGQELLSDTLPENEATARTSGAVQEPAPTGSEAVREGAATSGAGRSDKGTPESEVPSNAERGSEGAVTKSPLEITPDNLHKVYEHFKSEIENSDPKLSPNRAGEVAAARISHAIGSKFAEIDKRLIDGVTPEEEAFYDRIAVDRWNPRSELERLSGSRTIITDADSEMATRPLDAEPLPNKVAEAARNKQELKTKAEATQQNRTARERLVENRRHKNALAEAEKAKEEVAKAQAWRDKMVEKWGEDSPNLRGANEELARTQKELERKTNSVPTPRTSQAGERGAVEPKKYAANNPFADKARVAREKYEKLAQPSARDKAMEQSFPVGGGYGRKGGEQRIESSVNRAVLAEKYRKDAEFNEAKADAFERGEINAQGRSINKALIERSAKREAAESKRKERIASAKEARKGKEIWEIPADTYADSTGSLAGSGRNLVKYDHQQAAEKALADGKPVPESVLAEYPDLKPKEISVENSPFAENSTVDWGNGRGQGKRSNGMVMGGMSDMRGKKTYTDPIAKLNLSPDERSEFFGLENTPQAQDEYIRARARGENHDSAIKKAYTIQDQQNAPLSPVEPPKVEGAPKVDTSRKEVSLERGDVIPGEYGKESQVETPSGGIPAKYKLVEADSLIPSHNPETFAKNAQYPEGVQERSYHTSKEAQNRVIQQSQNYDPAYTVNTNPDAVNGPPVVTEDGVVLGGNSRAMATQRLYSRNQADAYKEAIKSQAQQFGIDPNAVDRLQRPVLVREVAKPGTAEEARRLGSELNKSMTGALGVSERAVTAGKSITPETLKTLSQFSDDLGDGATLRDIMREKGKDIVQMLVRDGAITERERPQFVDTSNGGLSEEGKTFVERAVRGLVVDDPDLMDRTPKSILAKLDGSLADVVGVGSRTDEYNLLPLLREALTEHAEVAQRGVELEDHLAQTGLFGGERNPAVDAIVRKLAENTKSVRASLKQFSQDANFDQQGQGFLMMGEQPSAAKAFNDAFGTGFTEVELAKNLIRAIEKVGEKSNVKTPESETEAAPANVQQHPLSAETSRNPGSTSKEQNPVTNPSRVVPGARSAATGNETKQGSLQQLTESIERNAPEKASLKDRMKIGEQLGAKAEQGKDAVSQAIGKVKGFAASLWSAYKNPRSSVLLPASGNDVSDYEKATGEWSGADNKSALNLYEFRKAVEKAIPDKSVREAMSNWIEAGGDDAVLKQRAEKSAAPYKAGYEKALELTDEQKTIARNIMGRNDATLEEMQKAGMLNEGVENYILHTYRDNPKQASRLRAEMNFESLRTNPSFTKQRKLPTYFDAEQIGMTPRDKDVAFLTAAHERALREALAARAFIGSLKDGKASDGRPLVTTSWASAKEISAEEAEASKPYMIKPNLKPGEDFADYRVVDHPSLRGWRWAGEVEGKPVFVQGDMLVHPEIYKHLKNNLTKSAIRNYSFQVGEHTFKPGEWALDANANVKSAILSLSGFHQTTLAIHGLEHRTAPVGMPELDMSDPRQSKLVDSGLMVAHYEGMEAFSEGVASGGIATKIPGIGPAYHKYVDYLFKNYMPRLKMAMAQYALDRNIERYKGKLSEDKIYQITAREANAAFGGLNYRMLGRNKTFQDVLRLTLMAPDFLEARAKFAAQAVRPQGAEQSQALMYGALGLYTMARMLNLMTDKKPHWDKPFGVVYGGKEYQLRTVQEDMYRAATEPGKFAMNRLSPTVSTAIQLGTGRDRFGKKQSFIKHAEDVGRGTVPIPVQPWTRKSHDTTAQKAVETIFKMIGINVRKANPKVQ